MSDAGTEPRRGRLKARRRQADARQDAIQAGVRREIPPYVLLRDEGLEMIEARTDELLRDVGVEFRGDQVALDLWREAGADVQGERVRFDPGLVRSVISATSKSGQLMFPGMPGAARCTIVYAFTTPRFFTRAFRKSKRPQFAQALRRSK